MFTRRTWAEALYALTGLLPSVLGLALMTLPLLLGTVLPVVFVGLPLTAVAVLLARGLGATYRGQAAGLLELRVAATVRCRPSAVLAVLRYLKS